MTVIVTRHPKYNKSKATSSLYIVKTLAKLEGHKVMHIKTKTNTKPTHTMDGTSNNKSRTTKRLRMDSSLSYLEQGLNTFYWCQTQP